MHRYRELLFFVLVCYTYAPKSRTWEAQLYAPRDGIPCSLACNTCQGLSGSVEWWESHTLFLVQVLTEIRKLECSQKFARFLSGHLSLCPPMRRTMGRVRYYSKRSLKWPSVGGLAVVLWVHSQSCYQQAASVVLERTVRVLPLSWLHRKPCLPDNCPGLRGRLPDSQFLKVVPPSLSTVQRWFSME